MPAPPALQYLFASAIWEEQLCAHTVPLLSSEGTDTHRHTHMHGCTQESKGRHALHIYVESTNMHGMNSAHTYEGTHTHRHSRPLTAHHLCAASDFSLCFVLCPCFCFHKRAVPFLLSTLSLIVPRLIRWVLQARDPYVMSLLPVHWHLTCIFFGFLPTYRIRKCHYLAGCFQVELSKTASLPSLSVFYLSWAVWANQIYRWGTIRYP